MNAVVATPSSDEMKTDIATHIKVLQSPAVLLSVVRDLKLQHEAPFAFKPSLMGAINGSNAQIEDEIKRGLPARGFALLARSYSGHLLPRS